MKNILAKTGFTTLVMLPLFFFSISQAEASLLDVDCDKGEKVQDELDDAEDGDVIEVSGTCVENITINKNRITLEGQPGATLTAAVDEGSTITVQGLNTNISGFSSISGSGITSVINVQRGSSVEIQGNTIENGVGFGIIVNSSAYARILGNTIQNNDIAGINVRQSASADILSNTVTGTRRQGIIVSAGAEADIDDNVITNNGGDGIRVRRTSHIRLSGKPGFGQANLIEGNLRAVRCLSNSSIFSDKPQNFGTGNRFGNRIDVTCVVIGVL